MTHGPGADRHTSWPWARRYMAEIPASCRTRKSPPDPLPCRRDGCRSLPGSATQRSSGVRPRSSFSARARHSSFVGFGNSAIFGARQAFQRWRKVYPEWIGGSIEPPHLRSSVDEIAPALQNRAIRRFHQTGPYSASRGTTAGSSAIACDSTTSPPMLWLSSRAAMFTVVPK